jgi:hypothetical protein
LEIRSGGARRKGSNISNTVPNTWPPFWKKLRNFPFRRQTGNLIIGPKNKNLGIMDRWNDGIM